MDGMVPAVAADLRFGAFRDRRTPILCQLAAETYAIPITVGLCLVLAVLTAQALSTKTACRLSASHRNVLMAVTSKAPTVLKMGMLALAEAADTAAVLLRILPSAQVEART